MYLSMYQSIYQCIYLCINVSIYRCQLIFSHLCSIPTYQALGITTSVFMIHRASIKYILSHSLSWFLLKMCFALWLLLTTRWTVMLQLCRVISSAFGIEFKNWILIEKNLLSPIVTNLPPQRRNIDLPIKFFAVKQCKVWGKKGFALFKYSLLKYLSTIANSSHVVDL